MSVQTNKPQNDDDWIFEALVNFLQSPLWTSPVLGFMEEKSVVFDPDILETMIDENEALEYRKLHSQYKSLVDFMLASFMDDMQITPEQVEEACKIQENTTQLESRITKVALEQLNAAEDFDTFRKLMTRKNIDLQLQTLELLVGKYGTVSESLRNLDSDGKVEDQEDEFLKVVIKQIQRQELDDDEDRSRRDSSSSYEGSSAASAQLSSDKASTRSHVKDKALEGKLAPIIPNRKHLMELKRALDVGTAEECQQTKIEQEVSLLPADKTKTETKAKVPIDTEDEEAVNKRRKFMTMQRDKLVELKKKDREMQLRNAQNGTGDGAKARPESAKAAQLALKSSYEVAMADRSMTARRALANRLKEELKD